MKERWKPEIGDAYYYVDNACSVDIERYDGHTWDDERIAVGNYFNTKDDAFDAAEKVKALLLSLHDNTNKLQDNIQDMVTNTCQAMDKGKENVAKATCSFGNLPKLTAEVFDRPDCPEWAKYAAVDVAGFAYWYQYPPLADERVGVWKVWGTDRQLIDEFFDAADWQNSLIERPVKENKLPDWCKVGEWIWHPEDMAGGRYLKITEIRGGGVYAKEKEDYDPDYLCFDLVRKYSKQARLRPYNAEEMKALLGKVVTEKEHDYYAYLVTAYTAKLDGKNLVAVAIDDAWVQAKDVLKLYTIDNAPCGVLEHLENGEWVK